MTLDEKIKTLPESSGVYIMRDISGAIIYIGKAVVLKNRVRQYFTNVQKLPKVAAMVECVADFDYIITLTEKDALSLEANLIKKHKPKYNILLKDDKSSPYIRIDMNVEYPTIEITRKVRRDGARYFGPYFNGIHVNEIVEIIKSAYKMRACPKSYNSTRRECLNYHIDLCLAPCVKRVSRGEYMDVVQRVITFLSGREDTAERLIEQKMLAASENEDFEHAILYRDRLNMLKKLKERNLAELGAKYDIDSFCYATDLVNCAVSVSIVRAGKMMGVKNYSVPAMSMTEQEALTQFAAQYYSQNNAVPELICFEKEFDTSGLNQFLNSLGKSVEIAFPKIGTKKKLIEMAKENARDYLVKSVSIAEHEADMTVRAAEELAKILNLKSARRIECYDISNISGTDKVASGIAFIDGSPSRSDYRRYSIKTVEGSDDYACHAEVMRRRLTRAKNGDEKFTELPDLLVIDGGKGQLSAAREAMQSAGFDLPIIALAEKNEEVFVPGKSEPLKLPKSGYPLKLLQRVRDEAHRFAITYNRNLRSRRYNSSLDKIKGVGKVKRKILLAAFERIEDIKKADPDTLAAINGIDRRTALSVYEYFHQSEKENQNKQ